MMIANNESYDAYIKYTALKKHFDDEKYDYHKYNGKIRAMKFSTFETRSDVVFYAMLAKKKDLVNFILSNLLVNSKLWVRDLCDDKADKNYLAWKKRVDSLTYLFEGDLNKLNDDFKSNFMEINGNHPKLITLLLEQSISLETFSILGTITNSIDYWKTELSDKLIARKFAIKAEKYYPFLDIDKKKFSTITKKHFFDDK